MMCWRKGKRVVKQVWLWEIIVQWKSLNGSFSPCSVHYSQNKSKRTSISALACCAALLPGWLLNDLSITQSPDYRFTSHMVKQKRDTVSASSYGGESRGVPHLWGWAIVLKLLLQYQRHPVVFSCKQTKLMSIFSVAHWNVFCVSLGVKPMYFVYINYQAAFSALQPLKKRVFILVHFRQHMHR